MFILATRDCFNQNVFERLSHILLVDPLKQLLHSIEISIDTTSSGMPSQDTGRQELPDNHLKGNSFETHFSNKAREKSQNARYLPGLLLKFRSSVL